MVERCGAKPVLVGCVWIEQFSAAASVLEPHPHSNPHGGPEHSGVAPVGSCGSSIVKVSGKNGGYYGCLGAAVLRWLEVASETTSGERPAGSGFQIALEVRRLPSRCSPFRSPAMSASFLALVQPFSCDSRFCAAERDSSASE
jgi:hypothetical protein